MPKNLKSILTLLFLSPLLTELLSGNMAASSFFPVGNLLILMTVAYGFPILIIREIVIRKQLGLPGLIVLGIMYGFYNEGLLAKTIFNPFHSPIEVFASYGLVGQIRLPWVLLITIWHAFFAVIYPISLTHLMFPQKARDTWLGPKALWLTGLFSFAIGSVIFFCDNSPVEFPEVFRHFMILLLVWIILGSIALRVPRTAASSYPINPARGRGAVILGALFFCFLVFIPIILTGLAAAPMVYYGYFLMIVFFFYQRLRNIPLLNARCLTLMGLGSQLATAFMLILLSLKSMDHERFLAGILFFTGILLFLFKLQKDGRNEDAASIDRGVSHITNKH